MRKFLLINLLILFAILPSFAQKEREQIQSFPDFYSIKSAGTQYWFTVPPALLSEGVTNYDRVEIIAIASNRTKITLELYDKILNEWAEPDKAVVFTLRPEDAQPYLKTGQASEIDEKLFKKKAINVYADEPFVLNVIVKYGYSAESFVPVPVSAMGKEYIVSSYGDASSNYPIYNTLPSLTTIVASYNETKVKFVVGENTLYDIGSNINPGDTLENVLNKGDVWMFSASGELGDLSGSRVIADKPVSVISGNQCANVPANNQDCDYLVEHEQPLYSWGQGFYAASIKGSNNSDRKKSPILRVYANEDNTSVYRNSDDNLLAVLDANEFWEGRLTENEYPGEALIFADKKISITTYNTGILEDSEPLYWSSPFQMSLIPFEQFVKELTFTIPNKDNTKMFTHNNLLLIFEQGENSIIPDDFEIAEVFDQNEAWETVKSAFRNYTPKALPISYNGKKYAVLDVPLSKIAIYRMRSSKDFIAYLYGTQDTKSYGMPVASNFDPDFNDSEPPEVTWDMDCSGNIDGHVKDMPENPEESSKMADVQFIKSKSDNYELFTESFVAGFHQECKWQLIPEDPTQDAYAVVRFVDFKGNYTIKSFYYYASKFEVEEKVMDFGLLKTNQISEKDNYLKNASLSSKLKVKRVFLRSKENGEDNGFTVITNHDDKEININAQEKITIEFSKDKEGIYTDSLFFDDDCSEKFLCILRAEVVESIINVSDIMFGNILENKSEEKYFKITNEGKTDLEIYGYEGPFTTQYEVDFPEELKNASYANPLILKAGDKGIDVKVKFIPNSIKKFKDSVLILSDAFITDSIAYFEGDGLAPGLIAAFTDFGRTRINRAEFPVQPILPLNGKGIEIENSSTEAIEIYGFNIISSIHKEAFILDSNIFASGTLLVPAGEKRWIKAEFLPEMSGNHYLEIEFINSNNSTANASLTGIGIVPRIEVEDVNFGISIVNGKENIIEKKIRIKNLSIDKWEFCDTLNIFDIEVLNDPELVSSTWDEFSKIGFKFDKESASFPKLRLLPGDELEIRTAFQAQELGEVEAGLFVISDAEENKEFKLRAQGHKSGLEITGDSVKLCLGSIDTLRCKIKNIGSLDIENITLKISPNDRDFQFLNQDLVQPFNLESQTPKEIEILFTPETEVEKQVTLSASYPGSNGEDVSTELYSTVFVNRPISKFSPAGLDANYGDIFKIDLSFDNLAELANDDINSFSVLIEYDPSLLIFLKDSLKIGEAFKGVIDFVSDPEIDYQNGQIILELKSLANNSIEINGDVLSIAFQLFYPQEKKESCIISHSIMINSECFDFSEKNTAIRVLPSCFDDIAKFRISPYNYELSHTINSNMIKFDFSTAIDAQTEINIYNVQGHIVKTVVNQVIPEGKHTREISTNSLPSGLYFYQFKSAGVVKNRKLVLIK